MLWMRDLQGGRAWLLLERSVIGSRHGKARRNAGRRDARGVAIAPVGIELAALAEQLQAAGIGLQFLTGELQGPHDPAGIVFTVLAALSGMEREYLRDRTLEGHESQFHEGAEDTLYTKKSPAFGTAALAVDRLLQGPKADPPFLEPADRVDEVAKTAPSRSSRQTTRVSPGRT